MTRLLTCPVGYHFSLSHRSCRSQEQVQRTDRTLLISELSNFYEWWQQLQRSAGTVGRVVCPAGLSGDYQHPIWQHKYISCATGSIFDCPQGQLFSLRQRLCVPAQHQGAHFVANSHAGSHSHSGSQSGSGFHYGAHAGSSSAAHSGSNSDSGSYGWIDLRHGY